MTILEDEFLNKKCLNRITKELRKEQLEKTILEIDYLNQIQKETLLRPGFTPEENEELDSIKKFNNARKKLQA